MQVFGEDGRRREGQVALAFHGMDLKVLSGFFGHCLSEREADHGEKC